MVAAGPRHRPGRRRHLAAGGRASFNTAIGTTGGFTIEIATGSTFDLRWIFSNYRFTNQVTLKYADPARPSRALSWEFRSCLNMDVDDLVAGGGITTMNGRFAVSNAGPSRLASENLTFNRPRVRSSALEMTPNTGKAGPYGFRFMSGVTNITVNDADFEWAFGGFTADVNATGQTGIVINGAKLRYFGDNFAIIGSSADATDFEFNDVIAMSPMRVADNATHLDLFQLSDSATNTTLAINRCGLIQADGDAFCQGPIWQGGNVAGADANTVIVNGIFSTGRAYHAIGVRSSKDWSIKNATCWKTDSGPVSTASTEDDDYVETGAWFVLMNTDTNHSGSSLIDNSIFFGTAGADSVTTWTRGSGYHAHGGSRTTPPTDTGFQVSNPKAVLDAIDYANMGFDEIVGAVKAALSPAEGGDYDRGGGEYDGAFKPDGSWAVAL